MPQVRKSNRRREDHQLHVALWRLETSEIDAFLSFVFQNVARRPEPLFLRETAGVVRYLRLLAWKGVPSSVASRGSEALRKYYQSQDYERDRHARPTVERLAEVFWGCLSQWGQIKPCTKEEALQFLRRHSGTYLARNPLLTTALKIIEDFEIPPPKPSEPKAFQPPHAMSGSLTAQGTANARLQDDLSERIYAAFHALKRSNVKSVRERLVSVLSTAVPRTRPESEWTYDAVNERVKEFENRKRKEFRKTLGEGLLDQHVQSWRDLLVDKWISSYCWSLIYPFRLPDQP